MGIQKSHYSNITQHSPLCIYTVSLFDGCRCDVFTDATSAKTLTRKLLQKIASLYLQLIVNHYRQWARETTATQQTRIIRIDCREWVAVSPTLLVTDDRQIPAISWFSIKQHCRAGNVYEGWLTCKFWGWIGILKRNIAHLARDCFLDKTDVVLFLCVIVFCDLSCIKCTCVRNWRLFPELKWVHRTVEWRYDLLTSSVHLQCT